MDLVKSLKVGNVTYNGVMASAVDQDRLLSLLTAHIMERAVVCARQGDKLDDAVLIPMFMAMPHPVKDQVAGILMKQVAIQGAAGLIDLDSFRGRLVEYNTLLAQLLMFNLGDFFNWLPSVVADGQLGATDPGDKAR